jgi:hypothetical protein
VPLLALIGALVVVWLVVAVIGAIIKGLFWLLIVALVLSVLTAAWGWSRKDTRR